MTSENAAALMSEPIFLHRYFFLDRHTASKTRELVERFGGNICASPLKEIADFQYWVTSHEYLEEFSQDPEEPRFGCRVVFETWIYKCLLSKDVVNPEPYTISVHPSLRKQTSDNQIKRKRKAADEINDRKKHPYTSAEDELLEDHHAKFWYSRERCTSRNEREIWEKAKRMNLLEGRTVLSMTKRFAFLKKKRSKSPKGFHYTASDDESLLAWAWCWKQMDKTFHDKHMWDAAVDNEVVKLRTAKSMEGRYERLLQASGGEKEGMIKGKAVARYQMWWSSNRSKLREEALAEYNATTSL